MTPCVRLVFVIHNHQPVGNFDGVFEEAYRDSYSPFLDVLEDYPDIPFGLHNSGSLLEWLADSHPEYIERIRSFVDRGQIEIIGGAFYEPILACIPRKDRIGQIASYSRHLEQTFGTPVRGMWIPERVWEQGFASDIVAAGIEYTVLDDFHFKAAGLTDDQLTGYYLTEDEGRLLKILPGSERLRYTIPFADPAETIDHLRYVAEQNPNAVVTFGDDGEKFGSWPETKKHVYEDGWLRRFLQALRDNSEWIKVVTPAESVDQVPPLGRIYLPDCSYREMTEWALPTNRQLDYKHLESWKKHDADWPKIRSFMRGGFWRNFRVKYPEANEMYSRMMEVSRRLESVEAGPANGESAELVNLARTELYRAQCNCSYWHGAFGGLYLPHLRNAVYRHLIAADSLLEAVSGRSAPWVEVTTADHNFDAMTEIRLAGDRLIAYFAPANGGHLYELDVRQTKSNLLATLNRRPEPYHETIKQAALSNGVDHGDQVASIHDRIHFKQPDLDKKLQYDRWPRKSLVDHFLKPGLSVDVFRMGQGTIGDFATGIYSTRLRRSDNRAEVRMEREGRIGPYPVRIIKTVMLDVGQSGTLDISYELENLPLDVPLHFGVEFNFAGMAAGQPDRFYYDTQGRQIGQLQTIQSLDKTSRLGLIDEWLGLDAVVESSQPAQFWTFPIETISQSEGGFEAVHQSCTVVPHWEFTAPAEGRWQTTLRLSIDTSVSQARDLREAATVR